jgi:hypothetical protein
MNGSWAYRDAILRLGQGIAREELFHQRHDPFVRILDDIVARIGQSVYLGARHKSQKPLQELRREAPIAHTPDKQPRLRREQRQAALDVQ